MTDNLEQLMVEAQQGNQQAYHTLLNACVPLIKHIIRQKITDSSLQEDTLQEVLISLHQARHTYEAGRPFKPWLYAITRFRVMDTLRKIYKTNDDISIEDLTTEIAEKKKNVTETLENAELVNKMLNTLPEKQKKIIYLMKVQGLSAAEVSLNLNMSISAVKVSAHRAMKTLKKKWEKEYVS